jgi:hypothetical protein
MGYSFWDGSITRVFQAEKQLPFGISDNNGFFRYGKTKKDAPRSRKEKTIFHGV